MLEDVIKKWGGSAVTAMQVYTDIFRLGTGCIQLKNEPPGSYKANPVGYYKKKNQDKGHFRVLFEDDFEEVLKEMQRVDFAILNGISYFGRRNLQAHASKMFAMIFDLDGVTDESLNSFFSGAIKSKAYPVPNYIALSGHGVHLYYVFKEPISLYPYTKLQLKELKYALTDKIWNMYTSNEKKKQFQGINQGFRVIGGRTKANAPESVVRAFEVNKVKFTISELCKFVPPSKRVEEQKLWKESKYTLEQAAKKFPDWYKKVILDKDKKREYWNIAEKVHGDNPYALYDWWKRQITTGASYGHRYFALMCLAIYAAKCDVDYDKLKKDALGFIPYLNNLRPEEPFTEKDCMAALECYDKRYSTFPVSDIEKISGIPIPKNKRNGRKRMQHMQVMRAIQEIVNPDWRKGNGRKRKANIVDEWRIKNPEGTIAECIKETGLSKPTVYKWWNGTFDRMSQPEEFTREEAMAMGAFREDALTLEDILEDIEYRKSLSENKKRNTEKEQENGRKTKTRATEERA